MKLLFFFSFLLSSFTADASVSHACAKNTSTHTLTLKGAPSMVVEMKWSIDGIEEATLTVEKKKIPLNVKGDWTNLGPSDCERKSIVRFEDVNFDDRTDVLVETSNGTGGQWFTAFLSGEKKDYERNDTFSQIADPVVDQKTKVIRSSTPGMTFHWKENKFVPVK